MKGEQITADYVSPGLSFSRGVCPCLSPFGDGRVHQARLRVVHQRVAGSQPARLHSTLLYFGCCCYSSFFHGFVSRPSLTLAFFLSSSLGNSPSRSHSSKGRLTRRKPLYRRVLVTGDEQQGRPGGCQICQMRSPPPMAAPVCPINISLVS